MRILRVLVVILVMTIPLPEGKTGEPESDRILHLSIPVSETVYRIRRFLGDEGYKMEQSSLKNNKILITAGQNQEMETEWKLELEPFSTLGTKLSIHAEGDGREEKDVKRLVDLLMVKPEDKAERGVVGNSQAIPEPVLNQIGNVACIHVQSKGRLVQFTGFFIDNDGLILCTAHDLLEHERVQILTNTGIYYEGDIVKADFKRDLALIKVDAQKEEIVQVLEGRNLLRMGETVFSIGCPRNLRGTIESGFVNGPPRKIDDSLLWQVHMDVQPGGSGSPVFDSSGTFVAVVKGRHREDEDIGFLIPLEVVIDFLTDYFSR